MPGGNVSELSRRRALRRVVSADQPLRDSIAELRRFQWDSERTLVDLTRADATRVLRMYLDELLSSESLTDWADALETREDLGFERGFDGVLRQLLFELANPFVASPIAGGLVEAWIERLDPESFEGAR